MILAFCLLVTDRSSAYTIENILTSGCHEQISMDALRNVRAQLATAPPITPTADEAALINDLTFKPNSDMKDMGAVTFLFGVRDNDLKGRAPDDLSQLALVHGDPAGQREHCLRDPAQIEPDGTMKAIADCRAYVREQILAAIDALDSTGTVDPNMRTSLPIFLEVRGKIDASLPTFYVRMGQAIHAVEDSFTHTFRTADGTKITVTLNWIKSVDGTLNEPVDGPAHRSDLDKCDDADDLRKTRHVLAIAAASELLHDALDPTMTKDQKAAAIDVTLDKYLSYSPGCTFGNQWCNAPELKYAAPSSSCGCRVAGAPSGNTGAMFAGLGLALAAFARRRGQRIGATSKARAKTTVTALLLSGALTLAPRGVLAADAGAPSHAAHPTHGADAGASSATDGDAGSAVPMVDAGALTPTEQAAATEIVKGAEQKKAVEKAEKDPAAKQQTEQDKIEQKKALDTHALPPPTVDPVKEAGPVDPSKSAIGAYVGGAGSIDKPALAGIVGARYRIDKRWTLGLTGEWNPFIGVASKSLRAGVLNVYGSGILRFPLAYENFNLRIAANLGVSSMLFDLYGVPKGSTGIFLGASPLAVEYKASSVFNVIIDPINIQVPIPKLSGVPFLLPQYRFTIGIEVYTR